jgi:hypothetical protein
MGAPASSRRAAFWSDRNSDANRKNREEAVQILSFGKLLALAAIAAVPLTLPTMGAAQTPVAPAIAPAPAPPPPPQMPPSRVPALSVDLMTAPGSAAFGEQWKTREAKIVERAPLPNHMPGYDKAYDISPHAGEAGYDDASWPKIEPKDLGARRGGGYVSFLWFRANLTIPAKIGDFETAGAKAVLTAYVDDYAEVWINGQMPRRAGYPSRPRSRASTCPIGWCWPTRSGPATSFRSRCSGSTGRSRWRPPTRPISARRRSNSTSKKLRRSKPVRAGRCQRRSAANWPGAVPDHRASVLI